MKNDWDWQALNTNYLAEDLRLEVRTSTTPNAGLGIFARERFPKGSTIEVTGFLVVRGSISDICTHYANRHKFRVGDDLLLVPNGLGAIVNHSDKPNMFKEEFNGGVWLEAMRDIEVGEELFWSYPESERTWQ